MEKVNINTCSLDELLDLPRIGNSRAQIIMEMRSEEPISPDTLGALCDRLSKAGPNFQASKFLEAIDLGDNPTKEGPAESSESFSSLAEGSQTFFKEVLPTLALESPASTQDSTSPSSTRTSSPTRDVPTVPDPGRSHLMSDRVPPTRDPQTAGPTKAKGRSMEMGTTKRSRPRPKAGRNWSSKGAARDISRLDYVFDKQGRKVGLSNPGTGVFIKLPDYPMDQRGRKDRAHGNRQDHSADDSKDGRHHDGSSFFQDGRHNRDTPSQDAYHHDGGMASQDGRHYDKSSFFQDGRHHNRDTHFQECFLHDAGRVSQGSRHCVKGRGVSFQDGRYQDEDAALQEDCHYDVKPGFFHDVKPGFFHDVNHRHHDDRDGHYRREHQHLRGAGGDCFPGMENQYIRQADNGTQVGRKYRDDVTPMEWEGPSPNLYNVRKFPTDAPGADLSTYRRPGGYSRAWESPSRSAQAVRKNPPLPKPLAFDGSNVQFRTFRHKFMSFVKHNELSEETALYYLGLTLTGHASDFFERTQSRKEFLNFKDALDTLAKRFDTEDLAQSAHMKLKGRKQEEGESYKAYEEAVWNLAYAAYPVSMQDDAVEREVLLQFITGLRDKAAVQHLLNANPPTMRQALDKLQLFEFARNTVSKGPPHGQQALATPRARRCTELLEGLSEVRQLHRSPPDSAISRIERTLSQVSSELSSVVKLVSGQATEMQSLKDNLSSLKMESTPKAVRFRQDQDNSQSPSRRDGWENARNQQLSDNLRPARRDYDNSRSPSQRGQRENTRQFDDSRPSPRRNQREVRCYSCSQFGHMASGCPNRRSSIRSVDVEYDQDFEEDLVYDLQGGERDEDLEDFRLGQAPEQST